MNDKDEAIYYAYMALYPNSLSRTALIFDSAEFMAPIVVLMEQAIKDKKPLTDAIFNLPDSADY